MRAAEQRVRAMAAAGVLAAMAGVLAGCGASGAAPAMPSPGAGRSGTQAASARTSRPTSAAGRADRPADGSGPQAVAGPGPRTSCRSVVHIGDSTSDGLVLPAYQPDPRLRIAAQYHRVGVIRFIPQVSGARSIVETWHGFPNAYTVAEHMIRNGYRGCWVLALGTNDTADVAVGSTVGLPARIGEMMSLIGNHPVLWINVKSLLSSGPYSEARMQMWNHALLHACLRYPDMRVYDWAAAARASWFIPDGIHYTPQGYAERSRLIADALALAFPATPPPPVRLTTSDLSAWQSLVQAGCLVH
jgi:hypothetical protein